MYKLLLLPIALLLISFHADAQFKKLLNKAKEKAIEAVTGEDNSSRPTGEQPATDSPVQESPDDNAQPAAIHKQDNTQPAEQHQQITFPITGDTVTAMHAVFAPVIDGDIKRITDTPEGKYYITVARQKGLKGSDTDIFRQLMKPENAALAEDISEEVKKEYPQNKNKKENVSSNFNPANGGFSTPSLYFEYMVGEFDMWMTNHYVKWATRNDHATMAQAFGVNVVAITDLQKRMAYSISSILGINYTMVKSLDTLDRPYGPLAVMPLFKDQYQGIEGIKIEEGTPEKFGEYNCSVVKIIIPVRPYMDRQTHKLNNSLLYLHDILSNRDDMAANNGKGNWDPSYRIIYKGYFSHDIEKYLPEKIREMVQHLKWKKGLGVGAAITDEKGNSADFRLIDITTDNKIDKGAFQIPDGYPVMTQEELNEAIKKQFSLKNMLRRGVQKNNEEN